MTTTQSARALSHDDLARRSVEVLCDGQAPSGAFVAGPSFAVYRFGWLRDGAFCAHALDLVGEHERARAFHLWVGRTLEAQRPRVDDIVALLAAGETPPHDALLPTRYTLDGALEEAGAEPWPNFQLDGYGTWLWALGEHARQTAPVPELDAAVELAARYLDATWLLRCYGCWEEFDDGEHAATVAAVAAGLDAAGRLLARESYLAAAEAVRSSLLERFVRDGRFARCAGDDRVDGSLLWLAVPFRVLSPDDSRIVTTVDAIRRDLIGPSGGVRRYLGDSYYGGGEWILLACSLGWHDAITGNRDELEAMREWVRGHATQTGDLPEQVTAHAQTPNMVDHWVERWGPVATPLLWSHAMYLVMEHARRRPDEWTFSR